MDIDKFILEARREVGKANAKAANSGLIGSPIAATLINRPFADVKNKIIRRKLKYQRDYIRSIILPISSFIKKFS